MSTQVRREKTVSHKNPKFPLWSQVEPDVGVETSFLVSLSRVRTNGIILIDAHHSASKEITIGAFDILKCLI